MKVTALCNRCDTPVEFEDVSQCALSTMKIYTRLNAIWR